MKLWPFGYSQQWGKREGDEEDDVATLIEVEVHPDGGRRGTTVIVVLRASREKVAFTDGGNTLKDREREGREKTSSNTHHPSKTRRWRNKN